MYIIRGVQNLLKTDLTDTTTNVFFSGDIFSSNIWFAANNRVFSSDNWISPLNHLANIWSEFFAPIIANFYLILLNITISDDKCRR